MTQGDAAEGSSRPVRPLDLSGRERQVRAAMTAMERIGNAFARYARRSLPFLARHHARIVPSVVELTAAANTAPPEAGPSFSVWLGTEEGLVRFDGVRFTVFDRKNTPELARPNVTCLLAARDGGLWIGTLGGGLVRLERGRFTSYSVKSGLPEDIVSALLETRDGALWIGTNDGLARYQGGRFRTFSAKDGLAPRVEAGILNVRARRENGATRIDVEDTGVGLPGGWSLATTKGTGLRNLASRLQAEFGADASLEVTARAEGGVRATVRVPFVPS